jgi:thiol:disulfide interchange protein
MKIKAFSLLALAVFCFSRIQACDDHGKEEVVPSEDIVVSSEPEAVVHEELAEEEEPYMMSQPIPESQNEGVIVVVAKNFQEVITEAKQDVMIEFYAPWCQ